MRMIKRGTPPQWKAEVKCTGPTHKPSGCGSEFELEVNDIKARWNPPSPDSRELGAGFFSYYWVCEECKQENDLRLPEDLKCYLEARENRKASNRDYYG